MNEPSFLFIIFYLLGLEIIFEYTKAYLHEK